MKRYNVGIIGNGFVGEAQSFAFSPTSDVMIYDKNPLKSTHTLDEVNQCDIVFICVPTPMNTDGSQNLDYIIDVFSRATETPIYVIKSTVLPGTTDKLKIKYPNLKIVFSPEFLTERTSRLDTITQSRVIFGGDVIYTKEVQRLYEQRFMNRHFIHTDTVTAELIKYMNNTFFATKVSIMNEFRQISDVIGANWETALYGFASDGRVGDSHLHVPGPDGKLGYGGTCFPKDVNALITLARENGINLNTIEGGWKTNLEVRREMDWEELEGRAVVKKIRIDKFNYEF
jgi:UDPglucose 6-dehydrogenase